MALKIFIFIFSLLILTEAFDLTEDEWEEFSPDVAAVHRLRGLSQSMSHLRLQDSAPQSGAAEGRSLAAEWRSLALDGQNRARRGTLREKEDPMSWMNTLQRCDNFTACVPQMETDFDGFLQKIDKQKVDDWLIAASEISHSYSQKLLVMTDDETSTTARVVQEYSIDPRYSAIIGTGCLNNASCLPEVDSYTLVKVFGRVSGDGLSVSGLSGSSLANLLLKTPLAAAPVFSLDGNTTTDFQHDFIRVSMARSIQAVLEVNYGNHHMYQVMDQPNSVSTYQIPQRPVDHSTQYDHQQILILEDDPAIRNAATSLFEKHPTVSSVYQLDQNHRPKLIHGESAPLSADSRLVLVGHGARDGSGEMRLGGFTPQDVSTIVQRTSRVGDAIKTVSVVACDVGSDPTFSKALLKDLHVSAGIRTELHVRDGVLQVQHTGEKITQEISQDGVVWKHKDHSKKLVATLDRNGEVIIRKEDGSKGEAVFTNERNFLVKPKKGSRNQNQKDQAIVDPNVRSEEPKRFVNTDIFEGGESYEVSQRKTAMDELQGLTWSLFHSDELSPRKIQVDTNLPLKKQFILAERDENNIRWMKNEDELKQVLPECYEVRSGEDVRKVVHYLANNKNKVTHVMVDDWILKIDPDSLYAFPAGKKLDKNQIGENNRIEEVKKFINAQVGKEDYGSMRGRINNRGEYVNFVRNIFEGNRPGLAASTEAWYVTYFTASIISESARNFRTFPLALMALDVPETKFFFEDHPMARGGSWVNRDQRGNTGTADPGPGGNLKNLKEVTKLEMDMFMKWKNIYDWNGVLEPMAELAKKYKAIGDPDVKSFSNNYENFIKTIEAQQPQASGSLGGYEDGSVAPRDLRSASELESSFKHESYFSRASASMSEEIHVKLKAKYGEHLAKLRVIEGSARVENGEFVCQLRSEGADGGATEFRTELSAESRQYSQKMLKSIDTAVGDMEVHSSKPSHQVSKTVEHIGDAVGVLGLLLGMKGAVTAFEHGEIRAGVVGTLQTAHGVAAMTTAVIAKQALSTETRMAEAATTIMKSPLMKRALVVVPMVGIGFGIYNVVEDIRRGDTLGYIDAAFDIGMIVLDVVALAVPELAPILIPINLALSVVRMVFDDVYMAIKSELDSLPADAGILQRLAAVFLGFGKGVLHFAIRVASLFYDWGYEEIENGRRLVAQISDYHDYYQVTAQDGRTAIDFTAGSASWNGGGIDFCLADQGPSKFCMDSFASNGNRKTCWDINTQGSEDIVLGLGESHGLQYKTITKKLFMFIPVGSETVVSGYETLSGTRYGSYRGNRDANRFFAVQKSEDKHTMEVMLSYYYNLYGEPGDDIFFLGPQRSYVEGSGGKDTYIIPEHGGKTIINNYDPSKALDTLHFTVDYSHISVSKSGNNVVLQYEGSHTVTIQNWFLGELYRHMTLLSGDGVLFEISSTVTSRVHLVARGINKMLAKTGQTVDASQTLLQTVTNILGSPFDDRLVGNAETNLMDGGGGRDHLIGGEGEDVYVVKSHKRSTVVVENYSRDEKTDVLSIEAGLHAFRLTVQGADALLTAVQDNVAFRVTIKNWFRSSADRHLVILTKDLITFSISENKADCQGSHTFLKCLKSHSIDYSRSTSSLLVDLQEDQALSSVTEVRGSNFDDVIKGNKEHNVFFLGGGNDWLEGRGGEDWYVLTPGSGLKIINNLSPDLDLDLLFLKEKYKNIRCRCQGQSVFIMINDSLTATLKNWFVSTSYQHLQIKTSDGITAGLKTNISSCGGTLLLPSTVDYRYHQPETLKSGPSDVEKRSINVKQDAACYRYRGSPSQDKVFCGKVGTVMRMEDTGSVKEMFGSAGFDIMVGNTKENLLDPYTGGALMCGGKGKDTYVIKRGYGTDIVIDNFAEDESIDTVLVDMDYLHGGQVRLDSTNEDLMVTIMTEEEALTFTLLGFCQNSKFQHLQLQSSDGVQFKLQANNATGPSFQAEAFKVTLNQPELDCHLDLSSQRNLSKVHTVQGCSSKSNMIVGNNQDNILIGGGKKDILYGGGGDDTLIGGLGSDDLIGGLGDDTLYGDDGDDTLVGNSGWDVFVPGMGADVMDGGPGRDTVVYRGDHQKREGVYVNLLTGQGRHADAEGDVLKDVETVIGTIYSDVLVSGYETALLQGSDGNDVLVSTGGDYLVGGDGSDIYMLAFKNASVTIDNCAKDNATDILYLNSSPMFDCQVLADRVLLNFYQLNQTATVTLKGWTSHHHECGHLKVAFRGVVVSVDRLLLDCQLRQQEATQSLIITSVSYTSLILVPCLFAVQFLRKFLPAVRQRKHQKTA